MSAKFRSLVCGATVVAALVPATAQAFTLVGATTTLSVNPTVGYTTSLVQVRATFKVGNICPSPPTTFKFSFGGAALWTKAVSACNASTFIWDTGWSGYIKPPVQVSAGKYVIGVVVYLFNGATCAQGCSAQFAYTAVNPRPSPPSQPTPTPTPTPDCGAIPVPAGCPSPTAKSCPAAMLPPGGTGGWGDNLIAALMVGATLPIAGLALFGPQTLLAEARRRRRFLILFGLSAVAVLALNCTFPTASTSQPTPGVAATPTPTTSSCSA